MRGFYIDGNTETTLGAEATIFYRMLRFFERFSAPEILSRY